MHQLSSRAVNTQQLVASGRISRQCWYQNFAGVLHSQPLGACRILDHEIAACRHRDADVCSMRCGSQETGAHAHSKHKA
jgi:hypothetical protein